MAAGGLDEAIARDVAAEGALERMTFFSDAVFAIAMTLLVIEVKVPHVSTLTEAALAQGLLDQIPGYIGYAVSFLVLGRFWIGHHRFMGLLGASDARLVWANLLMLFAVAFMPFPTAVLTDYTGMRVSVGFYTAWLSVIGFANRWTIHVALADHLLRADAPPAEVADVRRGSWIPLLVGVSGFAVAMIYPPAGIATLLLATALFSALLRRRSRRANAAD